MRDMVESNGGAAPRQPHAVVIGTGFGGLAAAVRLGARGYRVTVLEQLDAPGGRAYVFRQDGFVFDAGPTIITAPFLLEDLWKLCDRRLADDVELRPVMPFYRIRFDDGEILDCSGDDAAMAGQIEKIAPGDLTGYRNFLKASEAIYEVAFERLAHVPFDSFADMVRLAPELLRLRSYRSIYGLAASFVKNPRLRFALSFHPRWSARCCSVQGETAFPTGYSVISTGCRTPATSICTFITIPRTCFGDAQIGPVYLGTTGLLS